MSLRQFYPLLATLTFTVLSVIFRLLSRRDGDTSFLGNDFYVAQSLTMGSVSALAVYLFKSILQNNPASLYCLALLGGYRVLTGVLACFDRWTAWKAAAGGTFRRKVAVGILIPDVVGVAAYVIVFFFARIWGL